MIHLSSQRINEEIMREREAEIRNIHKGMHQVNEIYKVRDTFPCVFNVASCQNRSGRLTVFHLILQDLAHLVDNQQEGVDQIETQMENTKENTASGLKHIEKANESQQSQCVVS